MIKAKLTTTVSKDINLNYSSFKVIQEISGRLYTSTVQRYNHPY